MVVIEKRCLNNSEVVPRIAGLSTANPECEKKRDILISRMKTIMVVAAATRGRRGRLSKSLLNPVCNLRRAAPPPEDLTNQCLRIKWIRWLDNAQ
jgi:hypothetical protein